MPSWRRITKPLEATVGAKTAPKVVRLAKSGTVTGAGLDPRVHVTETPPRPSETSAVKTYADMLKDKLKQVREKHGVGMLVQG